MPASFLKIAGELVQNATLKNVLVTQQLNRHSFCEVECRQTADLRFPIEDLMGQDLQIVTYSEDGAEHVIFDGFLLEGELEYEIYGNYTARLKAVTRSYKLDVAEEESYWRKQTLADIGSALTQRAGVTLDLRCALKPAKNYVQWGQTAFSFLCRLADEHLAWIRPSASGIEILDGFQLGTTLQWRAEGGMQTFRIRGALSNPSFSGTHYNARTMESVRIDDVSKDPAMFGSSAPFAAAVKRQSRKLLRPGYAHVDARAATADEYRQLLEREAMRAFVGQTWGYGTSMQESLRPGDVVQIAGPLDAQGEYGLTKVVHRWEPTGYWNEFWCTPAKTYLEPEAPPVPRIDGLVTARVLAHNDPRKMGRIQVRYDWLEEGQTAWIRMAAPHAGHDRGFMFMPEIGDEVLVAFEHGDPERPYAIGSLWSGVDHAPREPYWGDDIEENDVKRIVTKSGHRITLSDKPGKEAITIATPSRLRVTLMENSTETNRSLVTVHSEDGDMLFSAPNGRIHFFAKYFSRQVGTGPLPGQVKQDREKGHLDQAGKRHATSPLEAPASSPMAGAAAEAVGGGPPQGAAPEAPAAAGGKIGVLGKANLASFPGWSELAASGKVTTSTQNLMSACGDVLDPFDAARALPSGGISAGLLGFPAGPQGQGELADLTDEFAKRKPESYQRTLASRGWTVEPASPGQPATLTMKGPDRKPVPLGSPAFANLARTDQARVLQPWKDAGREPAFQAVQTEALANRIAGIMAQPPEGQARPAREYVTSELGTAALVKPFLREPASAPSKIGRAVGAALQAAPQLSGDPRKLQAADRGKLEEGVLSAMGAAPKVPEGVKLSAEPLSMAWPKRSGRLS